MYKLYERVSRCDKYKQGVKPIEENSNPFSQGPCLLCVAAVPLDKSVFGMSREGMNFAGLATYQNPNAKFGLDQFPVKFLSLKPEYSSEDHMTEEEDLEAFTVKYFLPLVSSNNTKISISEAMRNIRNINILSYCDGTQTILDMLDILQNKMVEYGYSDKECSKILSQISLTALATNRLNGNSLATCMSFGDINDGEVNDNVDDFDKAEITKSPIKEALVRKSNIESHYMVLGNGSHTLKNFHQNGLAMPVCLYSVISNVLNNSIYNCNPEHSFRPISMHELSKDIPSIVAQAKSGKTLSEIKQAFFDGLSYDKATKLSDDEIIVQDELYKHFKEITSKTELSFCPSDTHQEKAEQLQRSVDLSKELSKELLEIQHQYFYTPKEL